MAEHCKKAEYTRLPGTEGTYGMEFERSVILYLLVKCVFDDNIIDFKILSNVDKAGPFDDIIFSYQTKESNWKTIMAQLKYSEAKKSFDLQGLMRQKNLICLPTLFNTFETTKAFCDTYEHIKYNGGYDNCDLILYTNSSTKNMEEYATTVDGSVLYARCPINGRLNVFKFDEEKLEKVIEEFVKATEARGRHKLKAEMTEIKLREFCKKLTFCTSQPSVHELKKMAINDIKSHFKIQGETERLTTLIQLKVEKYLREKKIFTKDRFAVEIGNTVIETLHKKNISDISDEDMFTEDDCIEKYVPLLKQKKTGVTVQLYSQCLELLKRRVIRVVQIRKIDIEWCYLELDQINVYKKEVLNYISSSKHLNLMVIEVKTSQVNEQSKTLLLDAQRIKPELNICIVLENQNDFFGREIKKITTFYKNIECSYQHQLNSRSISLQGEDIKLRNLLPCVLSNLQESVLWQLLQNNKVVVGKPLLKNNFTFIDRCWMRTIYELRDIQKKELNRTHAFILVDNNRNQKPKNARLGTFIEQDQNVFHVVTELSNNEIEKLVVERGFKTYHVFKKQDTNNFILQQSYGEEIDAFLLQMKEEEVKDLLDIDDKFIFISGPAGMGKTSCLKHLANTYKTKYKNKLVIPVVLNEHTDILNKYDFLDIDEMYELFNSVLKLDLGPTFVRDYLQTANQCVVFLDGLDEVCSKYKQNCAHIITHLLRSTKVEKLFVSSRPHVCLSQNINSKLHHFKLKELNKEEQIQCIESVMKSEGFVNMSCLEEHTALLSGGLLGVPLLAKLFGETLVHNSKREFGLQSKRITLLTLFRCIIIDEVKRLIKEKDGINPNKTQFNETLGIQLKAVNEICKTTAYHLIISKMNVNTTKEINFEEQKTKNINEIKEFQGKLSFVYVDDTNRPKFDHNLFAEYYSALWLYECYQLHSVYIKEIIYEEAYMYVRQFFDLMLSEEPKDHTTLSDWSQITSNNALSKGGRNTLHMLTCSGDSELDESYTTEENMVKCTLPDSVLGWLPIQYAFALRRWKLLNSLISLNNTDEILSTLTEHIKEEIRDKRICFEWLYTAIEQNYVSTLEFFYKKKSLVHLYHKVANKDTRTLLECSLINDNVTMIQYLLDHGFSSQSMNEYKQTPLYHAKSRDAAKLLIANGALVNHEDITNTTPLMYIVKENETVDENLVELILASGADINHSDEYNCTALHHAIRSNNIPVIELLIRNSATIDFVNSKGRTPLYYVTSREAADLLIANDASLTHEDIIKRTPLLYILKENEKIDEDLIELILLSGADINHLDEFNYTSLHRAVMSNNIPVIKLLIRYSATVDIVNYRGRTPLHCVRSTEAAILLLEGGANVESVYCTNRTVLHDAVLYDDKELVEALFAHSPKTANIVYGKDSTILHYVHSKDMMSLLLKYGAHLDVLHDVDASTKIMCHRDDIDYFWNTFGLPGNRFSDNDKLKCLQMFYDTRANIYRMFGVESKAVLADVNDYVYLYKPRIST